MGVEAAVRADARSFGWIQRSGKAKSCGSHFFQELISLYPHQPCVQAPPPTLLYPRRDLLFVCFMISTLTDVRHKVLCLPVEIFLFMHSRVMSHSFENNLFVPFTYLLTECF